MTNPELRILRGVPASGKSTRALSLLDTHVRVNRDDIRMMMWGRAVGVDENAVSQVEQAAVDAALQAGQNVVLDATNLRAKFVQTHLSIASEHGANVVFEDFPVPLHVAIARDIERTRVGRNVGEDVIRRFFRNYKINTKTGVLPKAPELWPTFEPYVGHRDGLPPAYIVDTDGTVAEKHPDRSWFDHDLTYMDTAKDYVADIVANIGGYDGPFDILAVSARKEMNRAMTENWWRNNGIPFDQFFFRADNDSRNDAIVKYEIFKREIEPYYNVVGAFDDRPRVLRMWRRIGIPTLQVGDGREF